MDPLDQLRSRFTGLQLREETPSGRVYAAQDGSGSEVTVAVLAGVAATDPAARGAFADAVWRHSIDGPAGRATVSAADLHAVFPWAAIQTPPGQAGAEQLLIGMAAASEQHPPAPAASLLTRLNRPGSPWPWLLGAAGGVLLVLVAATVIAGVQSVVTTGPGPPPSGPPADTGQPSQPGGADPDLPRLRPVEPVSVLGPPSAPTSRPARRRSSGGRSRFEPRRTSPVRPGRPHPRTSRRWCRRSSPPLRCGGPSSMA
ncbi:MAG: hypothetical protein GEV12_05300 [Micromonosporaceae bacterium]|nr:hypothetical protein [Micromonosporaceae bacterium]